MMRYQRVSPDYNPLSNNGSKSSFRCREEGENGTKTILTTTNGIGGGFRFRSPSKPPSQENNNTNHYNHSNNNNTTTTASPLADNNNNNNFSSGRGGGGGGGDVLLQLQWGHKKRARLSRTEIRSLTVNDDSSSSSSFHRRAGSPFIDKPPPPPPHSHPSNATSTSTRPFNLRTKDSSGFINNRNIEDRSAAANGSGDSSRGVSRSAVVVKGSPHSSEKLDKKIRKDDKTTNGSTITRADSAATTTPVQSEQETRAGVVAAAAAAAGTSNTVVSVSFAEKVNVEVIEWPKIYVALSRKEKEDDFLAMKGTKLPHRPKKRAKNIDRTLQYCFPGMWLSDLTKSRYEVREKKSVKKKKRRGLKGMESMESDSE